MNPILYQVLILASIFSIESFIPYFKNTPNRIQHGVHNLAIGCINGVVTSLLFSYLTIHAIHWAKDHQFGLLRLFNFPFIIEMIIMIVLFDFWMYVWHRANHTINFFWRFHRTHHSDTAMDSTSAVRFHVGEIILSSLIRLIVLPLLGVEVAHLIIYGFILQPIIIFHHSNIALKEKWDRVLRVFIVTPNMHRVHHSHEISETNSNYSSILSVWDRLGRSFRKREDTLTIQFGLQDFREPEWQKFFGLLKTPFVHKS